MNNIPETIHHSQKLNYIKLIALHDEYESFAFSAYCNESCKVFDVQMSDLKSGNRNIDRKQIEINRLINGRGSYDVKDWILEPYADEVVDKGKSAYFWVTIHVPEKTDSGIYRGDLTITSEGNEPVKIPVELKVLPAKLEDPQNIQFAMLYTVSPFGQYFKPDKYEHLAHKVSEFYKELRAHGMTAISPKTSDWPYRRGHIEGFDAEMKMSAEAGFSSPVLWYMSPLINGAKGGKKYSNYDGKCDNWNEERDIANLKDIIITVKETGKKENWPEVIFITVDEPGTDTEDKKILDLRMDILEKTQKTVYELGAKGATTVTEPLDEKHNNPPFAKIQNDLRNRWNSVRPYCYIRIYGYGYPQGQTNLYAEKNDSEKRGYEMWFYNNKAVMGNNRYMARVFFGLWGWKVGAKGLTAWTYPGKRTVQWELVREGIDDLKYLRLIERLSKTRRKGDNDRVAAEKFIQNVSDKIELDQNGYIKDWESWEDFDFVRFRQQAAYLIEKLS
jgi:hypothetical protein